MEQRVSNDAYHRGYVDVPSELVWDLPHIKRAIAWAYPSSASATRSAPTARSTSMGATAAVPTWSPPAAGWA
jgi:hypothetical protein